MTDALTGHNSEFFTTARTILASARQRAYVSLNSVMIDAYWQIGRRIVEEEQQGEQRAGYGEALIAGLSRHLGDEFGKGFSVANLKNFRKFYLTYPDQGKGYTLCSQLSWSHNRLIMREESETARHWYLTEAKEQGWSVRQLERQLKTFAFQRLLSPAAPAEESAGAQPGTILKDPYILEFLDLPDDGKIHEVKLETALIDKLQQFMLELGKGFSFVARQFRISTETAHFYVDLVFYNYLLKCFIVIDLKTAKLSHQDIGQMDMYVRMFDDLKRGEDDNPTLGIVLCADRDETIVRYSVLNSSRQLFASKYLRVLPSEEELARELEARHVLELDGEGEAE